jgi:hypothetical protein
MPEKTEATYDYFWDLASLDSSVRQQTAKALITHLNECFTNYRKSGPIPDTTSTKCEDFVK